jgi:hypothetical protein
MSLFPRRFWCNPKNLYWDSKLFIVKLQWKFFQRRKYECAKFYDPILLVLDKLSQLSQIKWCRFWLKLFESQEYSPSRHTYFLTPEVLNRMSALPGFRLDRIIKNLVHTEKLVTPYKKGRCTRFYFIYFQYFDKSRILLFNINDNESEQILIPFLLTLNWERDLNLYFWQPVTVDEDKKTLKETF